MIRRKPGWQADLARFLGENQARAFSWGEFDCVLFAAAWVERMTGQDFVKEYRGYKTKRGAISRLKKVAGGGVIEAAIKTLGDPLPTPLLARRGDVVAVSVFTPDGDEEPAIGVVDETGANIAVAGPTGLSRYPMERALYAWSVG